MPRQHKWTNPRVRYKKTKKRDDATTEIDPKFQSLSRINGVINKMEDEKVKGCLVSLGLCDSGVTEVLRKRLKNHYKRIKLGDTEIEGQYYPYFIVVDFEATCEEPNPEDYLHEIIEFPAVLIESATYTIKDEFHSYCRPSLNPKLSTFCKELTGIEQHQVDEAPPFSEVLERFESWLRSHNLLKNGQFAFLTDGCWDFSKFFNVQCCLSEVEYPGWARKWINLKKVYTNSYKLQRPRIMDMLQNLGLPFEGRLHCGADDARNLARIVIRLMEDGVKPQLNEKLCKGRLVFVQKEERRKIAAKQVLAFDLRMVNEHDDVADAVERLNIAEEEMTSSESSSTSNPAR